MNTKRKARHRRVRQLMDRLAGMVVWVGGIATILSIMGIFAYLVWEILPLFRSATGSEMAYMQVERTNEGSLNTTLVGVDEYQEIAFVVAGSNIQFFDIAGERAIAEHSGLLPIEDTVQSAVLIGQKGHKLSLATKSGLVYPLSVNFRSVFEGNERSILPSRKIQNSISAMPEGEELLLHAHARQDDQQVIAALSASGNIWMTTVKEPDEFSFSEEVAISQRQLIVPAGVTITQMVLDGFGQRLIAGTNQGELLVWLLREGAATEVGRVAVSQAGDAVTALAYLLGDRTLVVGTKSGRVMTWVPEERMGNHLKRPMRKVASFRTHHGQVQGLSVSQRDKGFISSDSQGEVFLHYATTGKTLLNFNPSPTETRALRFSPKADGLAWLGSDGSLKTYSIHNPHPEVTFQALFAPLLYEGYDTPELIWQSSSGSDEFEPKFGLMPLIFGTLKGTFYAMVLAIPLAVMGAVYTAMFMHPHLRSIVKPTIEIMAALPSVVLGFLAGLWFAPLLEKILPSILTAMLLLPVVIGIVCVIWQMLPRPVKHFEKFGLDLLFLTLVVGGTLAACIGLNSSIEFLVFGGDYKHWIHEHLGLVYDQRNAIVIGFAMGFAVIPIIFSIAEDSLSNVPKHLVAGSLALGATQWQTLTRLVLISASPGIFSALMIGFGRAIGETMIVLMATGNTPIMDWSVFNGFRTLSANIAVEMPEAPHGGTLYRILFLSGLLLFAFTFCINTVAEVIRQRLRDKYSQF